MARKRNEKRRNRAQRTNRSGDPRVAIVAGYPQGPVGSFGRPWRRMANYVARGEFLEREVERAETPRAREIATVALLRQVAKIERYQHVITR